MIWIGVDPGEKRIGIARSDPLGMLATPDRIAGSERELVELLESRVADGVLAGVVVGLPRNMDGTIGPIARRSLRLVARLRNRLQVPISLYDERLSTQHALRKGAGKRESVDARAAAIVLQSFLDGGCRPMPDPPELAEELALGAGD